MRFQQNTGPVMAKGLEDTVFYNFNRLVALNEVGGDPGRFGISPAKFHEECLETQRRWSTSMTTTTTHDTKRSEDVRARISLLSEIPERWAEAVERWSEHNRRHKTDDLPDRNAEYLLYQILVGAWPIDVERATAYMLKATREAKAHTSWTDGERGLRGGPQDVRRRHPGRPRVRRRPRRLRRAADRAGAGQLALAGPDQAHRPRRARHLPGERALGHEPGRPRQSPAGRLRGPPQAPRRPDATDRRPRRSSGDPTRVCPSSG